MSTDLHEKSTRRELLQTAAAGAAFLTTTASLSACGGSSTSHSSSANAGTPKRGGTLRAGVTGGGSGDILDADAWVTNPDGLRAFQLYDSLLAFDENAQPQLALAEEVTPNADATEWTIRLRTGITFHDGKPLTVDDVIYTFQRVSNPKKPLMGAANIAPLNLSAARKLDPLTVRIPCHTPFAAFPETQPCYQYFIVPVGYDSNRPVGTGPFMYQSFTPGQESTFIRNPNYWQTGLPYLDSVKIIDYPDETSQINALSSGQVDIIGPLSIESVAAVTNSGGHILASLGGAFTPFTMRLDQAPFSDIRVRQAMRLLVDRKQMADLVFGQYGRIANDLFAIYDPTFDSSLPQRELDVEQARSLLKQAGHENMTTTIVTADFASGAVKAAQIFAQQAKAAGVTVNVRQVPVTTIFGPGYLSWTFAQDLFLYFPYIPGAQEVLVPGAALNECHVDNPTYNRLFAELKATVDFQKRAELTHECQMLEYEGLASGYIIPYLQTEIDAYASRVHGLRPSKTSNLFGNYDLTHVWVT